MALGATCIPTIREEVVRLQQPDVIRESEATELAREAACSSARETTSGPRAPATRRPSLRHRLLHPVHDH